MLKKYRASYVATDDRCWDNIIHAHSWKEAYKDAKGVEAETNWKLYSVRLEKE